MSFPWESIEGWGFVILVKPRGAKALLGFFVFEKNVYICSKSKSHESIGGDIRKRRH